MKKNENGGLEALLKSGELMTMAEGYSIDVERIPTNIIEVDEALGGGIPVGKIVEVYGMEASGKSALALRLAGQAQKTGEVVYIDIENTLVTDKAENSGVDASAILIAQPNSTEEIFRILLSLAEDDDVSLVVVDSVAAMVSAAEMAGDVGDAHVAVNARLMSQGLKTLNQILTSRKSKMIVVFINQMRDNIGVMGFGPKKVTPGGRALKFFSSIRMEVVRTGYWKSGEDIIGQDVKVKVVKNKYSPPFREGTFSLDYVYGICNERILLKRAIADKRLTKSGTWYKDLEGNALAQGEINMIQLIRDNPEVLA